MANMEQRTVANLLGALAAIYALPAILSNSSDNYKITDCRRMANEFGKEVAKNFLQERYTEAT